MHWLRILVLLFIAVSSVVFGAVCFEDGHALYLFSRSAYWVLLVNCICLCGCLYWSCATGIRSYLHRVDFRKSFCAVGVVALSVLFVSRAEPMGYKTIMDEHIIASTARGLHTHRNATASMRFHYVNGRPVLMENQVDKRPVFFAFLVACVHDLFGYHPENSIRLNVYVLCPLLFVLLYLLGSRLAGDWGGGLLCFLVATIPLCGFIFRGGGLELLNLVLLVGALLLAMNFWSRPGAVTCGALCFTTTLLAHTRYESVVFVIPVVVLCGLQWWRQCRIEVYWPLLLAPILLVPYLWQNRVFQMDDVNWQLEGKSQPFALEYLPSNVERCIYYFFNIDVGVPNSWLLAVGSLVAAMFLLLYLLRAVREKRLSWASPYVPLATYLFGYGALFFLLLCYSWDFGGSVVQRLCLPLYLPMALAILSLLVIGFTGRKLRVGLLVVAAVYTLGYAFPVSSARSYETGYGWWEFGMIQQMFDSGELDKEAIYITENASFYSVYGYSCVSNLSANKNMQSIANYMALPSARSIYVVTRANYSGRDALYIEDNFSDLDRAFRTEVEVEKWLFPTRRLRFSRLVEVEGYEPKVREYQSLQEYQLDCLRMLP